MDQGKQPFRWVFLCTGNRCRSPFAAAYVAHLLRDVPVEITSVGVLTYEGMETPPELVNIARTSGLPLAEHRSRTADASLSHADLVVGFELSHVAHAVVELTALAARTFTLPELARLLPQVARAAYVENTIEAARRRIAAAAERRPAERPGHELVADPFGGPVKAYEEMATTVMTLCDQVVAQLFPDAFVASP